MTTVTIATINLHLTRDRWLQRRELLVGQLVDCAPDVIALQEVAVPVRQGQWIRNQLNLRLTTASPTHQYAYIQRRRAHPLYRFVEGVAILSRLPILSHDSVRLGHQGRVALRANLELPSGETLDVVTTKLTPYPHERQTREAQMVQLMGWLHGRTAVRRRVIAGCLHAPPTERTIERIKQFFAYRSAYEVVHGREPLATYPTMLSTRAHSQGSCSDYIFLANEIAYVLSARIFCDKSAETDPTLFPSDHVGIITTIDIGDK